QFFIHDRANFPGPGVGGEAAALISDLVGEADAHRPVPGFGHAHARTDVIAHPLPSIAGVDAGEDVEAGLEPIGNALGDLDGLVLGAVGGLQAIDYIAFSRDGVVAMQLDHSGLRRDRVGAVDLNFV